MSYRTQAVVISVVFFAVTFCASEVYAQNATASQYAQVFSNVSSAAGNALILLGNDSDQNFLKAMAASARKATFICDNIDGQQQRSSAFTVQPDSRFAWDVSGGTWPINETIVVCGTVTIPQTYRGDSVGVTFKFGAWGSALAYPGVKQESPTLSFGWVDYCPQRSNNCETAAIHPEPELPIRTAHVSGSVRAHDCAGEAEVTGGVAQVVLDNTEEGRDFNRSTKAEDICRVIPETFIDSTTAADDRLDSGHARIRFTFDVPIKGRGVSGYLYVCASVDRHKGSDKDSCEDTTDETHIFRKVHVTLEPNQTISVDEMYHDYTK